MSNRLARWCAAALTAVALVATSAAQTSPAPIPSEVFPLDVDSGWVENTGSEPQVIFSTLVDVADAAWLRLQFDQAALTGSVANGDASYLVIRSALDGGTQYLNATHVRQWRNTSAYFNGDTVEMELIAFPNTGLNRVRMTRVTAGFDQGGGTRSICGTVDDRQLSDDPRAGRAVPIGCTAWLITDCNRCLLTAGHCTSGGSLDVIEFNVPLSNSNGSIVHPPPEDQYSVDNASVQYTDGGIGNDWGYFGCFPNSNTGLTPFQAQGDAFTVVPPPAVQGQQIRITGYGTVSAPVSLTWNQVQKTHAGPYSAFFGSTVQYATDTTGGNSGSPVINESTGYAIGIHTHAGCSSSGGANQGTGANHTGLQAALAAPQGVCTGTALTFNYPDGLPALVHPLAGATFRVEVPDLGGVGPVAGTGQVHYDVGAGWQTTAMTDLGPNLFEATMPGADCGLSVAFYVSVEATDGRRIYDPGGCAPPPNPYSASAGTAVEVFLEDTFEADSGWTIGAAGDTATTGIWTRMDPEPTAAQPGDDVTTAPGVACWVTDGREGTSVGAYDLDGGHSTLTSPSYDLSSASDAIVSYWRWFSNDLGGAPNTDTMYIDISNNGGASWVAVEVIGPSGPETDGGWRYHEFVLSDIIAPSANMRLRFIAGDEGSGSIVEAAIDDLKVQRVVCTPCIGDLNGDLTIDLLDLSALLSYFGTTSGATYEQGDLDGDGDVDLDDLSELLVRFGDAC